MPPSNSSANETNESHHWTWNCCCCCFHTERHHHHYWYYSLVFSCDVDRINLPTPPFVFGHFAKTTFPVVDILIASETAKTKKRSKIFWRMRICHIHGDGCNDTKLSFSLQYTHTIRYWSSDAVNWHDLYSGIFRAIFSIESSAELKNYMEGHDNGWESIYEMNSDWHVSTRSNPTPLPPTDERTIDNIPNRIANTLLFHNEYPTPKHHLPWNKTVHSNWILLPYSIQLSYSSLIVCSSFSIITLHFGGQNSHSPIRVHTASLLILWLDNDVVAEVAAAAMAEEWMVWFV